MIKRKRKCRTFWVHEDVSGSSKTVLERITPSGKQWFDEAATSSRLALRSVSTRSWNTRIAKKITKFIWVGFAGWRSGIKNIRKISLLSWRFLCFWILLRLRVRHVFNQYVGGEYKRNPWRSLYRSREKQIELSNKEIKFTFRAYSERSVEQSCEGGRLSRTDQELSTHWGQKPTKGC